MFSLPQKALLALLKPNSDFDFSVLSLEDWQQVKEESAKQAVSLLAFDATPKCKEYIPKKIYDEWFLLSLRCLRKNAAVLRWQEGLIEILDARRFGYIILKGFASASYYPDPQKRIMGDVDFLIPQAIQKEVEDALTDAGYKKSLDEHICHRLFRKSDELLEMHFEVAGIPFGDAGDLFRRYLKDATEKYFENEQPPFRNPLPEIHGAIILLHTIHHLQGEGLGLRHFCDWAYFVEKTKDEAFWAEKLLPLMKKSGTLRFSQIITKAAHLYLGTACPPWAADADESLCAQLIADVFAAGNLGQKDQNRAGAGRMISQNGKNGMENGKLANQFLTLKNSMYYSYPFLRRWKILYPIIFVWRIIRYLLLMLQGKRPSLIKASAHADERMALYKQFKLYENE